MELPLRLTRHRRTQSFRGGESTEGHKTTRLGLLLTALALAGLTLGFVHSAKHVTLAVDDHSINLRTQACSVAELLAENGIVVSSMDRVTPGPFTLLQDGMQIEIGYATEVTIEAEDQTITILTAAPTVEAAIREAGIDLRASDKVIPGRESPVKPNLKVKITPVFHRLILTKFSLPYKTIRKSDPTLYSYASKTEREGQEGLLLRIEDVVYEGGKRVRTVLTTERVIASPVNKIVRVGAKLYQYSNSRTFVSRGGRREGKVLRMFATTYVPGHGCGLRTATGQKAGYGIVAVDPRVIPLGTRLYIEGYGPAVAADTGSRIKGNRIDLCFDSLSAARAFGNRTVTVRLVD